MQLGSQGVDVTAGPIELGQHLFAIAPSRPGAANLAVIGEAFRVDSGIVFTVNGAVSAGWTEVEAFGSLVPVRAHRRR